MQRYPNKTATLGVESSAVKTTNFMRTWLDGTPESAQPRDPISNFPTIFAAPSGVLMASQSFSLDDGIDMERLATRQDKFWHVMAQNNDGLDYGLVHWLIGAYPERLQKLETEWARLLPPIIMLMHNSCRWSDIRIVAPSKLMLGLATCSKRGWGRSPASKTGRQGCIW
jgi:hypothetical protein